MYAIIGSKDKTTDQDYYEKTYTGYKDKVSLQYGGDIGYGSNLCSTIVYELVNAEEHA